MKPTRLAPRFFRSATTFSAPRCSPQRTSVSRARFFASGQWLYHSMYMTCRSGGATMTTASVVAGHDVSQPTPVPARCSPHTSRWSTSASRITRSSAARRRAISASENRGYSAAWIAARSGSS